MAVEKSDPLTLIPVRRASATATNSCGSELMPPLPYPSRGTPE